jgi:hypothetical protein
VAHTRDQLPPSRVRVTVKKLKVRAARSALLALALGAQPEPIEVAAEPAFQTPGKRIPLVRVLPLEPIGERGPAAMCACALIPPSSGNAAARAASVGRGIAGDSATGA